MGPINCFSAMFLGFRGISVDFRRTHPVAAHRSRKIRK
jgi:hypothetical protein